jgi:hypothetical protein
MSSTAVRRLQREKAAGVAVHISCVRDMTRRRRADVELRGPAAAAAGCAVAAGRPCAGPSPPQAGSRSGCSWVTCSIIGVPTLCLVVARVAEVGGADLVRHLERGARQPCSSACSAGGTEVPAPATDAGDSHSVARRQPAGSGTCARQRSGDVGRAAGQLGQPPAQGLCHPGQRARVVSDPAPANPPARPGRGFAGTGRER